MVKKIGPSNAPTKQKFQFGSEFLYYYLKKYFFRDVFSQKKMTKLDFFEDQENFSKTILPKNVGK